MTKPRRCSFCSTKPRRCSATYPLGDGLVVRCDREANHNGDHEGIGTRLYAGELLLGYPIVAWPRKKKEAK